MTLRYVICDDNPEHLQVLQHMLDESAIGCCAALVTSDPQEVLSYSRSAQPYTLYFLDLKLDEATPPAGLQLCQQVLALDQNAYVVYVSAYTQYALLCCQSHAFDFLVKPFSQAQLSSCVNAVLVDIAKRSTGTPLVVSVGSRIRRLDQCRIQYFSRQRDYVFCHTLDGDFHWRESFLALYQRLDPQLFLRIHNGYIVNLHYVTETDRTKDLLRLSDQSEIPYSRRNAKAVHDALTIAAKEVQVVKSWHSAVIG